jgi:hypothetical protein
MSWAQTLKINSNMKKPLDKLNFELFYELAKVSNGGYGTSTSSVFIVPEYKEVINSVEYSNYSAKVIIIPTSVKRINTSAFASCVNLESINIPDSVTVINQRAFEGCTSLKSVRLPSSITYMGGSIFPTNVEHIFVPWAEGQISGAPWGATNATIHYNS